MLKKLTIKIFSKLMVNLVLSDLKEATLLDSKGNFFKPFNPDCETFDLEIVALALSRVKRFFGQTNLSVAQHSVMLAQHFLSRGEHEFAKQALLHEVGEAFMGDLVTPIKKAFPIFKEIEEVIMKKVFQCHDLNYPMSKEVHLADKKIMIDEALALMPRKNHWITLGEKLGVEVIPWSQEEAFEKFMAMANELKLIK